MYIYVYQIIILYTLNILQFFVNYIVKAEKQNPFPHLSNEGIRLERRFCASLSYILRFNISGLL